MKAPVTWIRELVDLPDGVTTDDLARRLTALGLKLEAIERPGHDLTGPLVLGRVLTAEPEPQKNGKTINWCSVDVGDANGTGEPQGIVCGAHNFGPGDLVVVVLPGAVLPGGFAIAARKTYGHVSAGMICSASELGLPDGFGGSSDGIVVLPADAGEPGDDAFGVLPLRDEVIEFEINPDRAYALSLRGVAREAALAYGVPFADPALRDLPVADGVAHPVEVEDAAGCPVFVTRVVSGFDPTATSPAWLQRRLQLAGMRPISLAVDVSNYVMLELGQPNHCYDADTLTGAIRVRRATAGEKLTTLDGVVRSLDTADLLIADGSGPIGIAGVMGGEATEISASTSRIVVEAAHFDPVTVFRSQKRHKLGSEASKRFERGVDPLLPLVAADRVAQLLVELGGGTVEPGTTYVGEPPAAPTIVAPADLPARISGIAIDDATTVAHLEAVGCAVTEDGTTLSVVPPSWRPDLTEPFDLVEEVVRIVGYDQVPSVLPAPGAGRGLTREQRLRRRVGRTLAGAGCVEVVSFPFTGAAALDALEIPADDERRRTVALANPLSSQEPAYTTTLLPGILAAAARNVGRGAPGVALFETGTVAFATDVAAPLLGVDRRPTDAELDALLAAVPFQPQHLAVVLGGVREPAGPWGPGRDAGWADVVEVVRGLATELGATLRVENAELAPWHPGRCARLLVVGADGTETAVGHAGELHPRIVTAHGLPARTSVAELDLDALLAATPSTPRGPSFSTYPVAKEDVALVVDVSVPAADVEAALREGAGELLESVRLFDVYTGEGIDEGRKSLAFALRFRAVDRTLGEGEAAAARDEAVALASQRTGAVQR